MSGYEVYGVLVLVQILIKWITRDDEPMEIPTFPFPAS